MSLKSRKITQKCAGNALIIRVGQVLYTSSWSYGRFWQATRKNKNVENFCSGYQLALSSLMFQFHPPKLKKAALPKKKKNLWSQQSRFFIMWQLFQSPLQIPAWREHRFKCMQVSLHLVQKKAEWRSSRDDESDKHSDNSSTVCVATLYAASSVHLLFRECASLEVCVSSYREIWSTWSNSTKNMAT